MIAISEEAKKVTLTPASFKYMLFLFKEGADKGFVPVGSDADSNVFTELQKKGVVERRGAKKGRGGSRGEVHILVPEDSIAEGNSRAPRGSKGTSGPRAPRTNMRPASTNVLEIPKSALPLKHGEVLRYIDATNSASQREFEKRKQDGLTDVEVSKAIKGLKGSALIAKLHELEAMSEQSFEQYLHTLGFPTEMISILGIPEPSPDAPDDKKQTVETALSNGTLTPPKPPVKSKR